jgi:predicted MFS family arabinose efflux permease
MTDGPAAAAPPAHRTPAGDSVQPAVVRRERIAVSTLFTLLGVLFGAWVSRIPAVADAVGAGPGLLGLILLAIAGGSVLSMPFVGRLCQRRSSTVVAAWFGLAAPLSLPLAGLAAEAGSPALLAAALAVFGATNGGLDVAMNANAVATVRHARRPLMPGFHGLFSVGGMLGAATGGLLAAAGLGFVAHFTLVAAAGVAATLLIARWLAADPAVPRADPTVPRADPAAPTDPAARLQTGGPAGPGADPDAQPAGRDSTRPGTGTETARPARGLIRSTLGRLDVLLVVLGAVTFCATLGEGAMADWTALFLRNVLHTSDSIAAAGYSLFSIAMAAARFGGGAVLRRWDPAQVVTVGCLLAAGGTVLAVLAPVAPVAVVGFAAVGAGLACAIPVTFNAAGAHRLGSGPAISMVTTVGYTGFLVGPPLIGLLAQWAGLRLGLSAVALACAIGALLAFTWRKALREHDPSRGVPAG